MITTIELWFIFPTNLFLNYSFVFIFSSFTLLEATATMGQHVSSTSYADYDSEYSGDTELADLNSSEAVDNFERGKQVSRAQISPRYRSWARSQLCFCSVESASAESSAVYPRASSSLEVLLLRTVRVC